MKEIVATLPAGRDSFRIKGMKKTKYWCCEQTLEIIGMGFEIPESCKKLWIQFHNRPATQRVRFEVKLDEEWFEDNIPLLDGSDFEICEYEFDEVIMPLVGKTVYVEVWYEEENKS